MDMKKIKANKKNFFFLIGFYGIENQNGFRFLPWKYLFITFFFNYYFRSVHRSSVQDKFLSREKEIPILLI